jgi:hypothetical protein
MVDISDGLLSALERQVNGVTNGRLSKDPLVNTLLQFFNSENEGLVVARAKDGMLEE